MAPWHWNFDFFHYWCRRHFSTKSSYHRRHWTQIYLSCKKWMTQMNFGQISHCLHIFVLSVSYSDHTYQYIHVPQIVGIQILQTRFLMKKKIQRLHPWVSSVIFICTFHSWMTSMDEKVIHHFLSGCPFCPWMRYFHPWMILTDKILYHRWNLFIQRWNFQLFISLVRILRIILFSNFTQSMKNPIIDEKILLMDEIFFVKIIHGWKDLIHG